MKAQVFADQLKSKLESLDIDDWKKTYDTLRDLALESSKTVFDKESRFILVSWSYNVPTDATMVVKLKVGRATYLRIKFEKPVDSEYATFFVSLSNKYVVPYMYPSYQYELRGGKDTDDDL